MAYAPIDIGIELKGLSDLQKMERRMEALEKEVTRLQKGLPKAANNVRKFGGAARQASGGVKALGAAVKSALGPLLAVSGAVAGFTAAFRTVAGQDFALAKVRSLGVDSVVLAAALKDVSAELEGNASVAELTAAAYDVASAGFTDAADAALVLKAASLGATGGFSDINTVGDAATSVLNAYGKSAKDAALLIDGFIQTQNDGKIVVDDYARNIGKVASAAAGLKIPIEEVNTVIAQSTAAGVQSEIAFTGLKGALARLASGEAAKALSDFGIEIDAASIEADGLIGTLKKLEGLDTGTLLKALGTEAGPALLPVIQNLEKTEKLLENQKNASGAAARAQQEAANTINGAWTRVRVAFENLFADQAALAQAIIPILDAVASAVDGITTATEGFKKVAEAVNGTINSLGEKLNGLSTFFGTLGESIKWAADQLGRLLLRADGFNDPGVQELMRTKVYDNSQGAGIDIEAIKKMSAAAAAAKKTTKQTTIPDFNPTLSGGGGGSGGSGGAGQAAKDAERLAQQTAERVLSAEKLLTAAQREGELLNANSEFEKAQIESKNAIFEIAEKYGELAAKSLSDEETNLLLQAQGLEVQNERVALAEKEAKAIKNATQPLLDQQQFLQDAITLGREEATIRQEIRQATEGLGVEDAARVEGLIRGNKALEDQLSTMDQMKELAGSISDTIENGLVNALGTAVEGLITGAEDLDESLKKILQGVLKDIANQMIKAGISSLFKSIGGGGAGGIFAGLFRAEGGPVAGGQSYIVGEKGPEIFTPGLTGNITSNSDSKAAMANYSGGNASAAGAMAPMAANVTYSGPTLNFNGDDYIPRSEASNLVAAGAKQGQDMAMKRLQNSRSQRARLGL